MYVVTSMPTVSMISLPSAMKRTETEHSGNGLRWIGYQTAEFTAVNRYPSLCLHSQYLHSQIFPSIYFLCGTLTSLSFRWWLHLRQWVHLKAVAIGQTVKREAFKMCTSCHRDVAYSDEVLYFLKIQAPGYLISKRWNGGLTDNSY